MNSTHQLFPKPLLALCLGLLLFLSCTQSEQKLVDRPKGLIGERKMVGVLVDLHLAEAKVLQSRNPGADTNFALYKYYRAEVFAKHKVDTGIYNRSFDYYSSNPVLLDSIYARVVDSLGLMESRGKVE